MKDARESLADVRRWICDNLSNGDAGRLCNMLSSVSRHISEIETKNEHLRRNYVDKVEYISALEQKTVCMHDENAQLRKLCADLYDHAAFSIGYFGDTYGILPRMRELGVEVDG